MEACSGGQRTIGFFASLAVIYPEMPAGEAAAERLFSTFCVDVESVPTVRKR
jgi:hypothetical protein